MLPRENANLFDPLVAEVRARGGQATVLDLSLRQETQREDMLALFDRSEAYSLWGADAALLGDSLPSLSEVDSRRRLRGLAEALQGVRRTDYYPGPAAEQAEAHLAELRTALDQRFSRGEPNARAAHGITRLDIRKHQGKRWATRTRPWVDRLACTWLIRRFIDREARFVWLADPAQAPRGALGFDYDGARFTHVGTRVSFEVMVASFGLDSDPRLQHIGRVVHYLDIGGIPVPEAAGLESVLAGLRELHTDDDDLVAAAATVFDALYAAPGIPS